MELETNDFDSSERENLVGTWDPDVEPKKWLKACLIFLKLAE